MNGGERGRPVRAVVTSTGAALRFFDGLTYGPPGDLPFLAQPHETAVDAGAGVPYVSHTYRSGVHTGPGEQAHEISVVDPHERKVVGVVSLAPEGAPHGLALNRDRGPLYATVLSADGLAPLVTAPVGRGPITIRRPGRRPRVRRRPRLGHRARRRPRRWLRGHGPGHRPGRPRHHARRPRHRLPPLTHSQPYGGCFDDPQSPGDLS